MPAIRKSSVHRLSLLAIAFMAAFAFTGNLQSVRVFSQEEAGDALFAFPPRTPERLIRAAVLANQLDRPILARQYLATFLETRPGRDSLNALRKDIGISVFLKLSSTTRLQPESPQVLAAINEAYPYPKLSPSSITSLADSLGQSSEITTSASLQILSAGPDAAVPLLNADPETEAGRIADQLLSRYAERFAKGLLGALQTSDPPQQTRILHYLAATGDTDLSFQILPYRFSQNASVAAAAVKALSDIKADQYNALTQSEAAGILSDQSLSLLTAAGKQKPTSPDSAGATTSEAGQTEAGQTEATRHLQAALNLATQAVVLNDSTKTQGAKLAIESAINAWPAQWPASSPESPAATASSADIKLKAAAIEASLQTQSTASLLELLKDTRQTSQILNDDPDLKHRCLMNHDPRVRLLGAAALWNQNDGSDSARNVVQSVIDGSKKPQAVVIDPRVQDGSDAVGLLREMGYKVDFERTGRNGFSTASQQLQCELVLVHSNCLQWPLSVTLANLRSDYRTANVPIVIYGPPDHRKNVAFRLSADPNLWFESEPLNDTTTVNSMQLQQVTTPRLSEEERDSMIRFALRLANAPSQ